MENTQNRRRFLACGLSGATTAWIAANWPTALGAAQHAHNAMRSTARARLEFFTSEMAAEIEAAAARIIPTTDTPGAREAGVVYFIDRSLTTFAKKDGELYKKGLQRLQAKTRELYPDVARFSAATPEQQDAVLRALDPGPLTSERPFRHRQGEPDFFERLREHVILGFLIDPDSDRRGNKDGVGWQAIGREREHLFRPPFGYYDGGYAGWNKEQTETEKR